MAQRDFPAGPLGVLMQELAQMPGVGPKSAERIAFHLLTQSRQQAATLAHAIRNALENLRMCSVCYNLAEGERCAICRHDRRDQRTICVVETPRDLAIFERSGSYRGLYHVLNGRLAPLEGLGPDQLTIDALMKRVEDGAIQELILATSPTLEGDGTALFIANMLAGRAIRVTRLARGIPSGISLEIANSQMLLDAMQGRQSM